MAYLTHRPSTKTPPPADPRMAKAQRWTVWTARKVEGKAKPSKVPVAKPTDPSTWNYYHAARAALSDPKVAGLGFEMFGQSGIVGIDIDNCLSESGDRNPIAAQIIGALESAQARCHVEVSPSGRGIRIFAGETPLPFHDFNNHDAGVEVYSGEEGRFLAFTGAMIPPFGGEPFEPLPRAVVELLGRVAPQSKWKTGLGSAATVPEVEAQPLPGLERRDDWRKLHPRVLRKVGTLHRAFLEDGAVDDRYASASEQLFALEQTLLRTGLKMPQAYQILISADGTWNLALEHRENSARKAKEFIWSDLHRAASSREKAQEAKALEANGWKDCEIVVETTEQGVRAKLLQLNVIRALARHPEWHNRLGWNSFDGRVTVDRRDATPSDLAAMSAWVCGFLKWPMDPPREAFAEAATEAAKTRPWNPIEVELRSLVWDGCGRVDDFARAMVESPSQLDRDILRRWLVGFVARGMRPGCEMHAILALTGAQGAYKTTFCRVMAGEGRYTDSPVFGPDKDNAMLRGGMRLIELGEGVAARRSDRHALKLDATRAEDHFRPPYGRVTEIRKRGFVYVLTANDKDFLRAEQDGLRRIWPVEVREKIDIEWIRANREQLLAEAVRLLDAGETWWWDEEPKELKIRQGEAVEESPFHGAVEAVVASEENRKRGYTTLQDVLRTVTGFVGQNLTTGDQQTLYALLRRAGLKRGQRRLDGVVQRFWRHPSWGNEPGEVVSLDGRRSQRPGDELLE